VTLFGDYHSVVFALNESYEVQLVLVEEERKKDCENVYTRFTAPLTLYVFDAESCAAMCANGFVTSDLTSLSNPGDGKLAGDGGGGVPTDSNSVACGMPRDRTRCTEACLPSSWKSGGGGTRVKGDEE